MRRVLSLVVVVAVAGAAVGCGDDTSAVQRDTSRLTAAELGWIRAYGDWTLEFYDDDAGSKSGAQAIKSCRDHLETVGSAPTERLEAAADVAHTICPLLARRGMLRRARDLVWEADDLLLPYFRDEQPLGFGTEVTEESRADIRLSERASESIDDAVEVRCWSDDDWRRVVAEDDAWNGESTDADDLVGFSDNTDERIHIVLDFCNTMSRVEAGDVDRWSRDDRIQAADALETLAHEIQHFLDTEADEATVECRAIHALPAFARRFGVSGSTAIELAALYRTEIYPDLDDKYHKEGGCPS